VTTKHRSAEGTLTIGQRLKILSLTFLFSDLSRTHPRSVTEPVVPNCQASALYGEEQRAIIYRRLERMDRELSGQQFIAGNRFTIADMTALVAIDIGGLLAEIKIAPEFVHLTRWHDVVSGRPSAKA
jgi:glutathione S-transferase